MKLPIYLDYSSTTPVDPRVHHKMSNYMTINGIFGNPSSRSHRFGWLAEEAVENSRNQIASLINADSREIIFTSGATESNNLAIKGVAHFYKKKGTHIITSKTEHKSVLDSCRQLEREGFLVTYLTPKKNGLIDIEEISNSISNSTILVSIMHVNNEIGIIQNIHNIGKICKEKNILFHVDATQSVGKIPINLKELNINLMSFSAHKFYGPMGIGALYIKRSPRIRLEPQQHGGGHERGMRSGTLPLHQIVGMGEACRIAQMEMEEEYSKISKIKNYFWDSIKNIEEIYLNGDIKFSTPYILNVSFNYIEGESLIMSLKDLAVSSGSACTSASLEPSYVLKALGVDDELAHSSIRFSFGKYTKKNDIDYAINLIYTSIKRLRDLSPLWEMYKKGINIKEVNWNSH
ncbi:MAG: IscS subfamily cysteine desulfurase [Arsenophonus sp.]|nr:MAG: IscS subfamily cysteine desulfurase [Arsenophonus sp.]